MGIWRDIIGGFVCYRREDCNKRVITRVGGNLRSDMYYYMCMYVFNHTFEGDAYWIEFLVGGKFLVVLLLISSLIEFQSAGWMRCCRLCECGGWMKTSLCVCVFVIILPRNRWVDCSSSSGCLKGSLLGEKKKEKILKLIKEREIRRINATMQGYLLGEPNQIIHPSQPLINLFLQSYIFPIFLQNRFPGEFGLTLIPSPSHHQHYLPILQPYISFTSNTWTSNNQITFIAFITHFYCFSACKPVRIHVNLKTVFQACSSQSHHNHKNLFLKQSLSFNPRNSKTTSRLQQCSAMGRNSSHVSTRNKAQEMQQTALKITTVSRIYITMRNGMDLLILCWGKLGIHMNGTVACILHCLHPWFTAGLSQPGHCMEGNFQWRRHLNISRQRYANLTLFLMFQFLEKLLPATSIGVGGDMQHTTCFEVFIIRYFYLVKRQKDAEINACKSFVRLLRHISGILVISLVNVLFSYLSNSCMPKGNFEVFQGSYLLLIICFDISTTDESWMYTKKTLSLSGKKAQLTQALDPCWLIIMVTLEHIIYHHVQHDGLCLSRTLKDNIIHGTQILLQGCQIIPEIYALPPVKRRVAASVWGQGDTSVSDELFAIVGALCLHLTCFIFGSLINPQGIIWGCSEFSLFGHLTTEGKTKLLLAVLRTNHSWVQVACTKDWFKKQNLKGMSGNGLGQNHPQLCLTGSLTCVKNQIVAANMNFSGCIAFLLKSFAWFIGNLFFFVFVHYHFDVKFGVQEMSCTKIQLPCWLTHRHQCWDCGGHLMEFHNIRSKHLTSVTHCCKIGVIIQTESDTERTLSLYIFILPRLSWNILLKPTPSLL
ncbi:hypothetical protein VP01_956g3 [Puccinia sorghi]|uniref:Uncharacterized protein n=1 Tax=Puccinia sorghi TaxID=27349 RepID=A0A0L6U8C9_9BASI|nr:hypothetical protein VP01_956g3 [Puccinia sorghi]